MNKNVKDKMKFKKSDIKRKNRINTIYNKIY